jgi:hypothetical protein
MGALLMSARAVGLRCRRIKVVTAMRGGWCVTTVLITFHPAHFVLERSAKATYRLLLAVIGMHNITDHTVFICFNKRNVL